MNFTLWLKRPTARRANYQRYRTQRLLGEETERRTLLYPFDDTSALTAYGAMAVRRTCLCSTDPGVTEADQNFG